MPAQELSNHATLGVDGPTAKGLLYKKSDRGCALPPLLPPAPPRSPQFCWWGCREFRPRYFELKQRRLNFWADGDAIQALVIRRGAKGQVSAEQHKAITEATAKGWRDIAGATLRSFEECCDGPHGPRTNWYGIEIVEEFGVSRGRPPALTRAATERGDFGDASPLYQPGDKTALFHHEVEARDMWMEALTLATRPTWVADSDPRASVCMESGQPFSFMDRRHHCRKCGGIFRKAHLQSTPLPQLLYPDPVWVCNPCATAAKPASRWAETKINTGERGPRGVAESLGNAAKDMFKSWTK